MKIQIRGIEFAETRISEVSDKNDGLAVDLRQVESFVLRRGRLAAYPNVQFVFGILLCCALLVPVRMTWRMVSSGPPLSIRIEAMCVMLAFLGAWLVWDSRKSGCYIVARSDQQSTRLAFSGALDDEDIEAVRSYFEVSAPGRFQNEVMK